MKTPEITQAHKDVLQTQMQRMALRNPSWGIEGTDYKQLYDFLAVQKITFLQDEEVYEHLIFTDYHKTGKQEELLDAYMILDEGDEIELKLFQFKFRQDYAGGVSTKELYAFVDRMNRVFLRSDLQDDATLEAFSEVRKALDQARKSNRKAKRVRIQCYYIVNGQDVSRSDALKIEEIRNIYAQDRQTYGFTFETYGVLKIYNLITEGRVPIESETLEMLTDRKPEPFLLHDIGKNPNGMPLKVAVGFVNVNQFTRLVDRYSNNELFEMNVRYFLGAGRDVNKRIIETITSDQSPWFGFMNNGVSITADKVVLDLPASGGKLKVHLENPQIINGCQTVNALYHAKYAPELKDKFQGNSAVMVRIYEIDRENRAFLDALIIATNSQNAIRPQDLLSNDPIQKILQRTMAGYGIGYERKAGEDLPVNVGLKSVLSKEDAAASYIGIIDGSPSKLRNSLSRREFFSRDEDYYRVFALIAPEPDESPAEAAKRIHDASDLGPPGYRRCLEILFAWMLREECSKRIAGQAAKSVKGALKKATYFLGWLIKTAVNEELKEMLNQHEMHEPSPTITSAVKKLATHACGTWFDASVRHFNVTRGDFIKAMGATEDSALKNTRFVERLGEGWPQPLPGDR
jgi:hypothetical protein